MGDHSLTVVINIFARDCNSSNVGPLVKRKKEIISHRRMHSVREKEQRLFIQVRNDKQKYVSSYKQKYVSSPPANLCSLRLKEGKKGTKEWTFTPLDGFSNTDSRRRWGRHGSQYLCIARRFMFTTYCSFSWSVCQYWPCGWMYLFLNIHWRIRDALTNSIFQNSTAEFFIT